jgi:hypothetical protein
MSSSDPPEPSVVTSGLDFVRKLNFVGCDGATVADKKWLCGRFYQTVSAGIQGRKFKLAKCIIVIISVI